MCRLPQSLEIRAHHDVGVHFVDTIYFVYGLLLLLQESTSRGVANEDRMDCAISEAFPKRYAALWLLEDLARLLADVERGLKGPNLDVLQDHDG